MQPKITQINKNKLSKAKQESLVGWPSKEKMNDETNMANARG